MSSSAQLIDMWRSGAFTLVISPQIMRELVAKLIEKELPDQDVVDLVTAIGKIGLNIPGAYESTRLDKVDPDDNVFLAAAYEAGADYIVSLDKKSLLPMKHFHGTQIRTPELLLRALMGIAEELQDEADQEERASEREQLRQET